MKKRLIFASIVSLFSSSYAFSSEPIHYYIIASQAQPFQIETDDSSHRGMVSDIVKAVFDSSQYEINYHIYPFNRMIDKLNVRENPNWLTYGSPSWGNIQSVNLSEDPIYNVKHVLLSSGKKPFEFNTIDDLSGKAMVLLIGFEYPNLEPYIQQGKLNEIRVKDYAAAFRVLNRTPGDTVFVEMESRIKYNLNEQKLRIEDYQMQGFGSVINNYPIHLAFDPEMDPKLQSFINQRLGQMKDDGQLNEIVQSYL
ncbi:transporter substrate-binding domain-containing protein [Vibrio toranzoniae]|uniref:substrate-binding periplasmic protein n=1 Tax=Vibrio toranzoniae TaxID=1194427 RepID=UPI0013773A1C|nr:transporter substrate-binding domain-containing protein [Vibrio toranzoniae]NAZ47022.1 transporter substrate-binding domain-containing protein [Vibrio toranzoniae]